jgi:uncharacterized protein (DUF1778 family)
MSKATRRKDHPLSMRLPAADIAQFVRDAAVRAAEDAVLDQALVRMSPGGFAAFAAAVAGPGKPVPELVALFKRRPPWAADGKAG